MRLGELLNGLNGILDGLEEFISVTDRNHLGPAMVNQPLSLIFYWA